MDDIVFSPWSPGHASTAMLFLTRPPRSMPAKLLPCTASVFNGCHFFIRVWYAENIEDRHSWRSPVIEFPDAWWPTVCASREVPGYHTADSVCVERGTRLPHYRQCVCRERYHATTLPTACVSREVSRHHTTDSVCVERGITPPHYRQCVCRGITPPHYRQCVCRGITPPHYRQCLCRERYHATTLPTVSVWRGITPPHYQQCVCGDR